MQGVQIADIPDDYWYMLQNWQLHQNCDESMSLPDPILEIVEDHHAVRHYKYSFGFWNKMFNIGIAVIAVLSCPGTKKPNHKAAIALWIVCYSCKQLSNRDD